MALMTFLFLRRLAEQGLEGRNALIQPHSQYLPSLGAHSAIYDTTKRSAE
jgi:hypothetical protein